MPLNAAAIAALPQIVIPADVHEYERQWLERIDCLLGEILANNPHIADDSAHDPRYAAAVWLNACNRGDGGNCQFFSTRYLALVETAIIKRDNDARAALAAFAEVA